MTRNLTTYRWTPSLFFDDFRQELNRLADGLFDKRRRRHSVLLAECEFRGNRKRVRDQRRPSGRKSGGFPGRV